MDMGGQLMEVEVNGSENILQKVGRIQMCNYGKKMFSIFIVSFTNVEMLHETTYFNLINNIVAKYLDTIKTFLHKILHKTNTISPSSLLSTILIRHNIPFLFWNSCQINCWLSHRLGFMSYIFVAISAFFQK